MNELSLPTGQYHCALWIFSIKEVSNLVASGTVIKENNMRKDYGII